MANGSVGGNKNVTDIATARIGQIKTKGEMEQTFKDRSWSRSNYSVSIGSVVKDEDTYSSVTKFTEASVSFMSALSRKFSGMLTR